MARLPRWFSLGLLVTLPLLLILMLRRPDSEPVPSRPETPPAGGSPSEVGAPVPGRGQGLNDVVLLDPGAPERPESPPGPEGAPNLAEPAGLPAYPLPEAIRWPSTPEAEAEIRAMLDLVADAIRSEKFVEMKAIIDAIKAHGTAAYGPLLEVLRQSDDSRLPIYAAVILAEMEVEHPDTELATALRDSALPRLESLAMAGDDAALRHAALVALGKVGDPGSFNLLVDALARENGGVLGEQAARSLTGLRGAEMTDALAALAREEPDPALRQSLTDALAAREDPASLETLESLARRDYSDEVRLAAIRGLAALPGAEADELLRDIARSPENADLRAAALTGLGISGDKRDLDLM
ncbi:MAG: HEAT repeat domain-containing protein, partial [Deltaproteobacteria bacterium]|nr:HEAT repeat domain-containing protein [Deltaproteobacteria bacterium]